jgi:threonine/homoserine/homoserine lactone efflux protein
VLDKSIVRPHNPPFSTLMPEEVTALIAVLAALTVGVVSPGPSFVMVARVAVASTRSQALAASLGMGVGGLLFGAAALLGLQGILHAVPSLYVGLKILGGLYLCYLGFLIFRSAKQPLEVDAGSYNSNSMKRSVLLGLATQVSNPKTAIVYASVFAALLPQSFSIGFAAALLTLVFLVEAGWYSLVALVLSSAGPQKAYLSFKVWVDRAAGAVMFGLGFKLLTSAVKP